MVEQHVGAQRHVWCGDVWGCVGVWFSGRWYWNNDAYLNQTGDSVKWHYNNLTWTTPAFING